MTAPWDGRYVVYRAYHASGALLYVGCTRQGARRWRQHLTDRRSAAWADRVHKIVVRLFPDECSALAAEARAIATEQPVHNRNRGYIRRSATQVGAA